ncbi:MAG: hypothetical protein HN348_35775, partial [Proteobacteria bacterium]|nr:hypothetical protein [Pseudomonadota bacterium]
MTVWFTVPARHPNWVATILAMALVLATIGVGRLNYTVDLASMFRRNSEQLPTHELLVALEGEDSAVMERLQAALAQAKGVEAVRSGFVPSDAIGMLPAEVLKDIAIAEAGNDSWRTAIVILEDDFTEDTLPHLRQLLAQEAPTALMVGLPIVEDAYEEGYREDQWIIVPGVFGVFVLLLALAFRQLMWVVIPIASIATSAWLVAGVMGWGGYNLGGPMTLVLPLVLVLGLADSIHLLKRHAEELVTQS